MQRIKVGAVAAIGVALVLSGCAADTTDDSDISSPDVVEDLAAMVPADIAERGSINLGVNIDIAPLKYIGDDGEVTGFSVEQFELASAVLGLDVKIEQGSFDSLIPGIDSGRYDALASLADIAERQDSVTFVDFLRAGVSWVASPDFDADITSRDDLCGHTVAVLKGSGAEVELRDQTEICIENRASELKLSSYNDSNAALLAVSSGQDELAMIDSPAAAYNAGQFPDKYSVAYTEYTNPNGIGFPVDRPELAEAYAAALKHLYDQGVYQELVESYSLPSDDVITEFPINKGPELAG